MKLTKTQKTRGRQLREEIVWLEQKIAGKHPITELADQESKLIDLYVELKELYPDEFFNPKGNIYSRIADIQVAMP